MPVNKPIILFGTGRSGTTIFMDALFRHGELAYFTNYLEMRPSWTWTNYLRNLHDNSYFRILKERHGSFVQQVLNPLISKPVEGYSIWKQVLPNHVDFSRSYLQDIQLNEFEKENVYQYIDDIISKQNRSRIALKITGPGRLLFLSELFPTAKFIWLKRDFIPTLSSFLKVNFWDNRKTNELWWKSAGLSEKLDKMPGIKSNPVLFTAFQVHEIIASIERSINKLDINVYTVDYKNFTSQPVAILREALDFCELDHDKECFSFLNRTNIENRNKPESEYFDEQTLLKIKQLRKQLRALEK